MTKHDDFRPAASIENLRLRAELLRRLREFFDRREFLEVETPLLSADTVVDRHLDPLAVELADGRVGPPKRLWLQTSPEFCMKRLLAAGSGPIYQVTRAFRAGEQGPLHNGEFTMVEWYGPGHDMDQGMRLTSDVCETLLDRGPAEQIAYADAFGEHVGLDPHASETGQLIAAVRELGIRPPESLSADDRDGWLDLLLVERVQPHLGKHRPTILYDYPASQAALARIRGNVAERFELYVSGIELANGYHELLDPAELRRRNHDVNAQRQTDGKPTLPEESRLLAAMESGLPPSVGVALGFDRTVMLAAGAETIAQVMPFPMDRA